MSREAPRSRQLNSKHWRQTFVYMEHKLIIKSKNFLFFFFKKKKGHRTLFSNFMTGL
jgi:hypothetical protein